ncbi:MAG: glycosyltransferase family 39 protein [Nitrospinae bacterium]|nr:glycosyltransferase family 39 protein [Nitrospinota bacterium]
MREIAKRPAFTGLLIFIAGAVYYLSFARYGLNLWDEGGIYIGGMRTLQGQRVYVDFFGYPPGGYWLVELVFRWFGFQMLPVRWLYAGLTALFGVLAYHIARRIMPGVYTAAAVLLVMSAPAVYYQRFYGLMFLFCAWAAIVCLEDRRNWPWLAVSAATACLFKAEVTLVALPVFAWVVWRSFGFEKKGWVAFLAIIVACAAFLKGGMVAAFFAAAKGMYQVWGNPFPVPWKGYQGSEFGFFAFLENLLFYAPFATAAALGALAWRERNAPLAALAYFQLMAMCLVILRAGFDNLIRCLPLFFIVAVYLACRAVKTAAPPRRVAAIAALAAVWGLYMADLNWKNGYYAGSIGAVREFDSEITRGRAKGIIAGPQDAAYVGQMTDWIDLATQKDDRIFAMPLNPLWYYLSGRMNPTAYDWVLPGMFWNPSDEEKLIAQMAAARPPLIILVDIAIDNREDRRLTAYVPGLIAWTVAHYRYSGRIGYFQMWSRK